MDSAISSSKLTHVVVMGVAGCGKSSVGAALAQAEGLPLIEGDDFHGEANRAKMAQGVPLTDEDRQGWLDRLARLLQQHPQGVVLTCSALKIAYRERLRAACPNLAFVYLEIGRDAALARVANRSAHFFSASLVDSQFATLQPPLGEARVLPLDATAELTQLQQQASAWLHAGALA
ncbi:MAG TPA: gluconokinase [Ideonella sp.]|uniref:gluconokinase n=1 Tax=Ideonella sp. TaxID=1929293 RepID=UPI002C640312|nr:gluconokinase [Ideonella sp.]HSI49619.1 gluconokinase [Ideonella sp.]